MNGSLQLPRPRQALSVDGVQIKALVLAIVISTRFASSAPRLPHHYIADGRVGEIGESSTIWSYVQSYLLLLHIAYPKTEHSR